MKKESIIFVLILASYVVGGSLIATLAAWLVNSVIPESLRVFHVNIAALFAIASLCSGIYMARCVAYGHTFRLTKYYKTYVCIWLPLLWLLLTSMGSFPVGYSHTSHAMIFLATYLSGIVLAATVLRLILKRMLRHSSFKLIEVTRGTP